MRPHILLLSITSLASARISTDKSSLPEGAWMPKELGRFHIPHAGFIEAYDNEEGKKDLYITTFNPALPYFHDPVFMIPNPGEKLNSVAGWANEVVTLGVKASAYWPNFPVKMNKEVVGFEGVVQTSGFLVPGKNTGKLELYNRNDNARGPIDIAAGQDKDWSYHWVIWKDVDDDGLIDALTARFRVPGFIEGGDPISQLLWFKNPGGDAPSTGHEWPWQSSILLTGGPDVYIEETIQEACNPDCVEYSIIVTGELWNERIMLYYVENTPGAWSDPSNIRSVVVDAAPGQPFEARFGDANNDGKVEIFASAYNQDPDNKTGNFWMYQEQDDGTWRSLPAHTTRILTTRRETSGCTRSRTTARGRESPWPPGSSPTRTSLAAPWRPAKASFSGQATSTRTLRLPLGRTRSRGSPYQATTTVFITSCSQSLRILRIGNTTSR